MKPLPQKLQAAIYSLTRKYSYINHVLLNVQFREQPGLGTFGVDKHWRCYFDPQVVEDWSMEVLQGTMFHEMNHLLRDHPERAEPYDDHQKMNIAEDMEINPDMIALGLKLPDGVVFPKTYAQPDNMLAEEYYHKIPDQPGQGGKGKKGEGSIANGKCGSCAGNPIEGEEGKPADGEGLSKAEKDLIKRQVAKDIEQHVKSAGNMPAGLARWANSLLHPQVKWTKELSAIVRRAMVEVMGKQDRTFKKPSRIAGGLDGRVLLPGWKGYAPNVALVFDTSGSMGETDLAKSLAECKGILNALGGSAAVSYVSVDCQASKMKKANRTSQIKLEGGGGTDMGIGIRAAMDVKPRVDICVVLTDGYTPWPSEPPPFKTIVVLTQTGAEQQVPSWAKHIMVN